MSFKATDEKVEEAVRVVAAIPVIPLELQQDMNEACINIDDKEPADIRLGHEQPNYESGGTVYPSMFDFRLAIRQHDIVHEF